MPQAPAEVGEPPRLLEPGRYRPQARENNIVHLPASNAVPFMTYCAVYDRPTYEGFIAGIREDGYRANVRSAIKRISATSSAPATPPSRRSRTTPASDTAGASHQLRSAELIAAQQMSLP